MERIRTCAEPALLLVVAAFALGCGSQTSNTGFTGTWERPLEDGYSRLSIRQTESGYFVRWSKSQPDHTVRCDDQGNCDELFLGKKVYEWQFRASTRPDSDDLFLEVLGKPADGAGHPMTYVDRLELQPGGNEIWSYQLEQNGIVRDPPSKPRKLLRVPNEPS
jgi:hypothetical protein